MFTSSVQRPPGIHVLKILQSPPALNPNTIVAFLFLGVPACAKPGSQAVWRPWPKIQGVKIDVSISTRSDSSFEYAYRIVNPKTNRYPITGILLDLRLRPEEHPFRFIDLTSTHTASDHIAVLNSAANIAVQSVQSPPGWKGDLTYPGSWGAPEAAPIRPGESKSGFSISAMSPPGIREWDVMAYDEKFFNTPEEYDYTGIANDLTTAVNLGIDDHGYTLVPVPLGPSISSGVWLSHVIHECRSARALQWIASDQELVRLSQSLKAIAANPNGQDHRNEIESVVNSLTDPRMRLLLRANLIYLRRLTPCTVIQGQGGCSVQ